MNFNTEDDAWEYWENNWYESGKGYEGGGENTSRQVDMFNDWKEEEGITLTYKRGEI